MENNKEYSQAFIAVGKLTKEQMHELAISTLAFLWSVREKRAFDTKGQFSEYMNEIKKDIESQVFKK